jgi:hypothetical protein
VALPADWPTEQDSQRHPLEHADDFLGALQRLIPRTRRHLVVQAPTLDTALLGSTDIGDLIGRFIRQSRFCRVQVLFNDADSALAGSHRLITLARRFPSYITLLQAQPDDRQRAAWLIADARALIWRPHDRYAEGYACAAAPLAARGLLRDFEDRWARARPDPRLRQLFL